MRISIVGVSVLAGALAIISGTACHRKNVVPTPVVTHWSPATLIGCYEILDAKYQRADTAWYNVMAIVRLTQAPARKFDGTIRPNAWHLRPLSNAGNGRWRADPRGQLEGDTRIAPWWSLNSSGDSAEFNFRDGFSGASIQFAAVDAHGDTLPGHVTEHWDSGPPFSQDKGRAYAVRRVCPR
jgi:hypothetical protein